MTPEAALVKRPTTRQLVQYAGAAGDFYEMHYDQDFARALGLPGVILHGLLKAAFLGELVGAWASQTASLTKLEVTYRGMDLPGQALTCRGRISAQRGREIDVELWTENPSGSRTTIGAATLQLTG